MRQQEKKKNSLSFFSFLSLPLIRLAYLSRFVYVLLPHPLPTLLTSRYPYTLQPSSDCSRIFCVHPSRSHCYKMNKKKRYRRNEGREEERRREKKVRRGKKKRRGKRKRTKRIKKWRKRYWRTTIYPPFVIRCIRASLFSHLSSRFPSFQFSSFYLLFKPLLLLSASFSFSFLPTCITPSALFMAHPRRRYASRTSSHVLQHLKEKGKESKAKRIEKFRDKKRSWQRRMRDAAGHTYIQRKRERERERGENKAIEFSVLFSLPPSLRIHSPSSLPSYGWSIVSAP